MKKRSRPLLTAGASSLLLIFLSLCLLTFSVLSLASARADYRLSVKIADRTQDYYRAFNEANDILAEIDEALMVLFESTETESAYLSGLSEALHDFSAEGETVSFTVPIHEDQVLSVVLSVRFPTKAEDTFYTIRQWKTINTSDWTPDTRQNLYIQPES